ncbi:MULTISPECIES: hypothetical protein [Pseudomonas]|uniref:Uncharacterized protein n=1 Tax=Pseudomonas fulva TaxID=47880 RepID=A0A0D0JPQ6_9PSED|nr:MULTISPECIES: hypothetical protein [Pseudomonas]KIP88756.1 hypothetical protein RU08_24610 [Pseudomonas fulva]
MSINLENPVFTASTISEIDTLEALNRLFDIEYGHVFIKDTYHRPLRSYNLINSDARCQFLKHSRCCDTAHQRGYVVETTENKLVLIGHCCALKHLGLDDEQVQNDFKRLTAAEKDALRRQRVQALLERREELTLCAKDLLKAFKHLQAEASSVLEMLPAELLPVLVDRWKRNALKVMWEYMTIKHGRDERGRAITEKAWYPHECGTLRGLGAWLQFDETTHLQQLYEFLRQFKSIPLKVALSNAELASAEAVLSSISALDLMARELELQRKLIAEFCALGNLIIQVQLFANRDLRARVVEAVHRIAGQPLTTSANRFVDAIDEAIRTQYKAAGIRIAT